MSKIDIKQLRPDNVKNYPIEKIDNIDYYRCQIAEDNSQTIRKIGYVCPLMDIYYPFYLKINGERKKIYVGKTGIYEIQFEKDLKKEIKFSISEVYLPKEVDFIFDYEEII